MSAHPFDPSASGKNPFPPFEESMAVASPRRDDNTVASSATSAAADASTPSDQASSSHSALNWSIDTIAELRPMEFSPLPEQKTSASETPATRSTTFFEDEAQYHVLQTPLTVIRQEMNARQSSKSGGGGGGAAAAAAVDEEEPIAQRLWSGYRSARGGESAQRWRDLHQRCVETTQFCEARLRERELKLQRFHIPACKLKHKTPRGMTVEQQRPRPLESLQTPQSSNAQTSRRDVWETPAPSRRREPLTPVIATRLSFGSVDLSPILPSTQEKKRLKTAREAPSPALFSTPPVKQRLPMASSSTPSFLSSIAPTSEGVSIDSPQFSLSRDDDNERDDETKHDDKENSRTTDDRTNAETKASPLSTESTDSSLRTMSLLRADGSTTPNDSSLSSNCMTTPSPEADSTDKPASAPQRGVPDSVDIAARQRSFVAAIEEEAADHRQRKPPPPPLPPASSETETSEPESTVSRLLGATARRPPATSVASLYREAKTLGLTEPSAQYQYVQLLSKAAPGSAASRQR